MTDKPAEGVKPYHGPAGGWGALRAVAQAVREQMGASANSRALMQMNQPEGFDCPGCAWPDPKHTRSEEHTSELQSLMRISYAVFCLKKKTKKQHKTRNTQQHNTNSN